jgi:hypothetical protein
MGVLEKVRIGEEGDFRSAGVELEDIEFAAEFQAISKLPAGRAEEGGQGRVAIEGVEQIDGSRESLSVC